MTTMYIYVHDIFPCCNTLYCHPQRIPAIVAAFNDNNVSFVVRGGLQVLVLLADPNAGTLSVNDV